MPDRAPSFNRAARPLVVSLIPVLFCTAASAASLYPRGPAPYANRAGTPGYAVPGYGYRPAWPSGQFGYGAGMGLGGRPAWPSPPQGVPAYGGGSVAPNYPGRGAWPAWQQAPTQSRNGAGTTLDGGHQTWPSPPQQGPGFGGGAGNLGDGGSTWRPPPKQPVTHLRIPKPPPPLKVVVAPPPIPPAVVIPPAAPQLPAQPAADTPPPAPPMPSVAPPAPPERPPIGKSSTTHTVTPPTSPPPAPAGAGTVNASTPRGAAQAGSPIGTSLGALGALALALPLARLLVKGLRRRWRRNRGQSPARVVLVSDRGRTRMIATGAAPADPVIELRLLTATPVSTLRLAA